VKGSGRGLIIGTIPEFAGWTEGNRENLSQDGRVTSTDSKRGLAECDKSFTPYRCSVRFENKIVKLGPHTVHLTAHTREGIINGVLRSVMFM
jgi:hypothetical protein